MFILFTIPAAGLTPVLTGCSSIPDGIEYVVTGEDPSSPKDDQKPRSPGQNREEALEEEIIGSPYMITSDYFRKTADDTKTIRLFGDSGKEKALEERVAQLEERLAGMPERAKGPGGLPVLRRKVVVLSLLGDLGLDVMGLLPAALRRTDGIVPIGPSHLSRLLHKMGKTEADLALTSVRRQIAADAGIHAYILVYLPQDKTITDEASDLRIDMLEAVSGDLIGSYMASIDEFDQAVPLIAEDLIRATEWSCRIIKVENGRIFLNAGRLTGLRPGDRLGVFARGEPIIDPITGYTLGFALGDRLGEIQVIDLFGVDACETAVISGERFKPGDVVKVDRLT